MDHLTPEQLGAFGVAIVIIVGAIGRYLAGLNGRTRQIDPVLAGVGLAFGDKEQTERLISVQTRIAVALESLADKRTDEMAEMHRQLLDRLDRRAEQEEPRPRRAAPRRRNT